MKKLIKTAVVGFYCLAGSAVMAQASAQANKIPADMLDLDRQRCENDCIPAYGETTCKPLCGCTVREYGKRLDFDAYLKLSVELSRNEISPESRTLLDSIAKMCTAELDAAGIQVGAGTETPNQR